ncbi:MAG: 2-dehydropantoate 2-reductase [Pseudomonadota bacterium]
MSVKPLDIAVMGAGGIGGYLAARLAAAGHQLFLIARGSHLAALQSQGLTLRSELGDVQAIPAGVSDDPAAFGPMDYVIFTVKGQDSEAAAAALAPLVGPQTTAIGFQNGLSGLEALGEAIGIDKVLAGVTYLPAVIEAPGVIRHTGSVDRFVFGEQSGPASPRVTRLAEALQQAGVSAEAVPDALAACWHKFIMLAPFSGLSALTRADLGDWRSVPETFALYRAGMEEVAALARAKGVPIAADIVETNVAFTLEKADPRTRGSMLSDLERGRPLELESLSGYVAREGARLGVATPVNAMIYGCLKPFVAGATSAR